MFTVKQVADRLDISEHTIRYYDRKGLMPFLKKEENGKRLFTDDDVCLIELIVCLKNSHMSLAEIKRYIEYQISEDDTRQIRVKILENHKNFIKSQIEELNKSLSAIDYKLENCVKSCCDCEKQA